MDNLQHTPPLERRTLLMIKPHKFPFSFLTSTFHYHCYWCNWKLQPTACGRLAQCDQYGDCWRNASNSINAMHISLRVRCTCTILEKSRRTQVNQYWRSEINYSKIYITFTFYLSLHCVLSVFRPPERSFLSSKCHSQGDTRLRTSLSVLIPVQWLLKRP